MQNIKSPYIKNEEDMIITDEGFGRFSKAEIVALKVFKDNEKLLNIIKKAILQVELPEEEKTLLTNSLNKQLFDALSKVFVPRIEDTIMGATRWADRKYSDIAIEETKCLVLARQDSIKFIESSFKRLDSIINGLEYTPSISLDLTMSREYENVPAIEVKRQVVAFQDTMIFVENQISAIIGMINMREETEQEKQQRLKKDSMK